MPRKGQKARAVKVSAIWCGRRIVDTVMAFSDIDALSKFRHRYHNKVTNVVVVVKRH